MSTEELQTWYEYPAVVKRWRQNPMGDFMTVLAGALETESRSAENRRKEKERANKRPTISDPRSIQTSPESNISAPFQSPTTDIIEPLAPTLSLMAVSSTQSNISQHKRTASTATTASYGNSSTPQNIDKPEPHVQELQNTFVRVIMKAIWPGGVPISWAQGRKMWLDYVP